MNLRRTLIVLVMTLSCFQGLRAQDPEEASTDTIEAPSPDGRYAFRHKEDPASGEKTFDLIEKESGKSLARIAEADPDMGPSARFNMEVLWRSDSKAFAVIGTLWKRGSYVDVYMRAGSSFRKIDLPELTAEIPNKVRKGKKFPHIVELNSQSAKKWQKDGSLQVEIENAQDGEGTMITALRKVVLGFPASGKAKILKSEIKFSTE